MLVDACIFKAVKIGMIISVKCVTTRLPTYDDVEVFSRLDLTSAEVPADA